MEIDDEANCGTDPDEADTAKSTSSTHDSASLEVITTNNSPTMMTVNNAGENSSAGTLPNLIILAETRL